MINYYEIYKGVIEFLETDAFKSLNADLLSNLSYDALFRLQALTMEAIAKKTGTLPSVAPEKEGNDVQ